MFLILVKYKKPVEIIDQYRAEHLKYLEEACQKKYLIVSGRNSTQDGGIIFTQFKTKSEVENFIKNDPYAINELTHYEIIEFKPGHFHPEFAAAFLK